MTDKLIDGIENYNVLNALLKARQVIPRYLKVAVSISGGSDSDIMLDIVEKVKGNTEVVYYFIDTGLEYQATKDHLDYLEDRYGIEIKRIKAEIPIPTAIKRKGVPFLSKMVSEYIYRLQKHDFGFEDKPLDALIQTYPRAVRAIKWWCNDGKCALLNVENNLYLKEFLMQNPPDVPISAYCCEGGKKRTAKKFLANGWYDLDCVGVRKAEGGARSAAYKSCWDENHPSGMDHFRPIFWLTDEDKRYYEKRFGIVHSRCYTQWGLKRTGCVGCPFNRKVVEELAIIEQYEPKMYKACMAIFGKSYEYTKKYRAFQTEMRAREKAGDQLMLTELVERME